MEPSSVRRMTLRELMVLARDRLGPRAADFKTRDELVQVLFGVAPVVSASAVRTQDFFLGLPRPPGPEAPVRTVITRDFFLPPHSRQGA